MIGRFLRWWVTWAVVGALLAALVYVAVRGTGGRTTYEAVRPPQTALEAQTAPELAWTPPGGSGRLSEALATRPTSEEEAGVPSAPVAASPLLPGPNPEPFGLGNRAAHRTGSALEPPLVPARSTSCDSPCAVDVSSWDIPMPEPVLRPLASDCRLPCYGTARIGPASWYNAGSGYYAAIPGYVGGVVSVAVCTFPNGQANCHTFPVTSSCQCYRHERRERVVDLSPSAYRLFAPLSSGLVMVQITVLGGKP